MRTACAAHNNRPDWLLSATGLILSVCMAARPPERCSRKQQSPNSQMNSSSCSSGGWPREQAAMALSRRAWTALLHGVIPVHSLSICMSGTSLTKGGPERKWASGSAWQLLRVSFELEVLNQAEPQRGALQLSPMEGSVHTQVEV